MLILKAECEPNSDEDEKTIMLVQRVLCQHEIEEMMMKRLVTVEPS